LHDAFGILQEIGVRPRQLLESRMIAPTVVRQTVHCTMNLN
jgi:hypothetical protein